MANVFQLLSTLSRMRIQRSEDQEARRQLTWMLDAISALALLYSRPPGGRGRDRLLEGLERHGAPVEAAV